MSVVRDYDSSDQCTSILLTLPMPKHFTNWFSELLSMCGISLRTHLVTTHLYSMHRVKKSKFDFKVILVSFWLRLSCFYLTGKFSCFEIRKQDPFTMESWSSQQGYLVLTKMMIKDLKTLVGKTVQQISNYSNPQARRSIWEQWDFVPSFC